jgi:hypothetical protein
MNKVRSIITRNWHPGRAAIAGTVATLVYSVTMEGDKFITGNRFSDVRFIEGLLVGEHPSFDASTLSQRLSCALQSLFAMVE